MSLRRCAVCFFIIASMLITLCAPALAEERVTITADTRVYVEPDTDSDSYGVKKGWEADLLAYGKGDYEGWARIQNINTGKIFYIKSCYLSDDAPKAEEDSASPIDTAYVMVDNLPLYEEDSISSDRVRSLTRGRVVNVYSEEGAWTKVEYKGKEGYVLSAGLSEKTPASTQYLYAARDTALYLKATSASDALASIDEGDRITVYAKADDWYITSVSGKVGYVRASHLSGNEEDEEIEEETAVQFPIGTAYVMIDNLPLLKEDSLSSGRVRSLTRGRVVNVYSTEDEWTKVEYKGKEGYVLSAGLCEAKPASTQRLYAVRDTAAYLKASSSSDELVSFDEGDRITVYAKEGDWYIVSDSGKVGYIRASHLSENKSDVGKAVSGEASVEDASSAREYSTMRKTGYVDKDSAKVYAGDSTDSEVKFSLGYGAEVSVREISGDGKWVKIRYDGDYYYMLTSALSTEPVENDVILADWFASNINSVFKKGTRATITHVDSGLCWTVVRRSSTNHADVEPVSAADTAIMKEACADSNGEWTYSRQAVIVTINGQRYAASIYTEPHGNSGVSENGYSGHFCIHFYNSRTHGTDRVDEGHQAMVLKAYNAF